MIPVVIHADAFSNAGKAAMAPEGALHGKACRRYLILGRALIGVCAAFAVAMCGFISYNLHDGHVAGEASGRIVHAWDGLDVSMEGGEAVAKDGDDCYIGIVAIPSLGIELPVNREWSTAAAKQSPCRYTGSVAESDLTIAAHNFGTQFGGIHRLMPGDVVTFTDTRGMAYKYEVAYTEILEGTDVAKMQEGDWDLTLFTCTIGGRQRVTVRCQYADL